MGLVDHLYVSKGQNFNSKSSGIVETKSETYPINDIHPCDPKFNDATGNIEGTRPQNWWSCLPYLYQHCENQRKDRKNVEGCPLPTGEAIIDECDAKNYNADMGKKLKDSGERTTFGSGATRELSEDKGRCDLLPVDIVAGIYLREYERGRLSPNYNMDDHILCILNAYEDVIHKGNYERLYDMLIWFINHRYNGDFSEAFMQISHQYKDGASKYAERNWELGMPVHSFMDSSYRHILKYIRNDQDEPHDRAFMWNIIGAIWTIKHRPKFNDLPCETVGYVYPEIECDMNMCSVDSRE
jgi:hypothetical protein